MKSNIFRLGYFLILTTILGCSVKKSQENLDEKEVKILAFTLCEIYISDQNMRKNGVKINKKEDSVNFVKTIDIITKYGFPNQNLLGSHYDKECVKAAAVAVLLHHPKKIVHNIHYKNLLIREYKKGNLDEKLLLTFFDKYYWAINKGEKGYLGVFGKPCIEDKKISDSLRQDLGFQPLDLNEFRNCQK